MSREMSTPAVPSPDEASTVAVLKSRARELARPTENVAHGDANDHVVFRLGPGLFAISLDAVLEVFTPRQVTPLPGWPRGSASLTAWRGDLLLILDVREFLGIAAAPNTLIDRTIVLKIGTTTAGVIVDEIMGIEQIDEDMREPVPARLTGVAAGTISGITNKGVIILDSAALLSYHTRGGTK